MLKTYTPDELKEILKLHKEWLSCIGGSRADLSDADLSDANLRGADLSDADLRDANLRGADLSDANLRDVKHNAGTAFFALSCPEEGDFIGWKTASGKIVKLLITGKRSSATTRKCRCSEAKVLDIFGAEEVCSDFTAGFIYKKGKTVKVEDFDENRWNECSRGIHFFITREEAENYK